jgi:hypothetical protein
LLSRLLLLSCIFKKLALLIFLLKVYGLWGKEAAQKLLNLLMRPEQKSRLKRHALQMRHQNKPASA